MFGILEYKKLLIWKIAESSKLNRFSTYFPTNTPRGFHVETTWKRPFPRRFNVESTWCVCGVIPSKTSPTLTIFPSVKNFTRHMKYSEANSLAHKNVIFSTGSYHFQSFSFLSYCYRLYDQWKTFNYRPKLFLIIRKNAKGLLMV